MLQLTVPLIGYSLGGDGGVCARVCVPMIPVVARRPVRTCTNLQLHLVVWWGHLIRSTSGNA